MGESEIEQIWLLSMTFSSQIGAFTEYSESNQTFELSPPSHSLLQWYLPNEKSVINRKNVFALWPEKCRPKQILTGNLDEEEESDICGGMATFRLWGNNGGIK
jgi:hypothetical protein